MSETKIKVPDEMLKYVISTRYGTADDKQTVAIRSDLEAALRWVSESDDGNLAGIIEEWAEWPAVDYQALIDFFRFAKRRMFLAEPEPEYCPTCGLRTDNRMGIAPEPEEPEAIKLTEEQRREVWDAYLSYDGNHKTAIFVAAEKAIEAYRRGERSAK